MCKQFRLKRVKYAVILPCVAKYEACFDQPINYFPNLFWERQLDSILKNSSIALVLIFDMFWQPCVPLTWNNGVLFSNGLDPVGLVHVLMLEGFY